MTRKEQIGSAYKMTGGNAGFYDGMMTYSTLPGKAICRAVWNMNAEKNLRYIMQALSGVPEDFGGKLLEVPVGTGVLTMPVYRDLPDADVTCLDYSADMMRAAKRKADLAGIKNVTFRRGDATALDFPDESFDAVVSNYVYHNIPTNDRQAVLLETLRVLKKGGTFALHDIFSKSKYGDMRSFVQNLRDMGFEKVELIDTTDGTFMTKKEASWMALSGSALLVGRK